VRHGILELDCNTPERRRIAFTAIAGRPAIPIMLDGVPAMGVFDSGAPALIVSGKPSRGAVIQVSTNTALTPARRTEMRR
jgi:hypothetical protein